MPRKGSDSLATKANNKKEVQQGKGWYIVLIAIILVLFCSLVALLLVRDSAEYTTKNVALKYYESITKNDSKSMEKLLNSKDVAKLVKVTESFDKYFNNITSTLISQYGEGFMVTVEAEVCYRV